MTAYTLRNRKTLKIILVASFVIILWGIYDFISHGQLTYMLQSHTIDQIHPITRGNRIFYILFVFSLFMFTRSLVNLLRKNSQ